MSDCMSQKSLLLDTGIHVSNTLYSGQHKEKHTHCDNTLAGQGHHRASVQFGGIRFSFISCTLVL